MRIEDALQEHARYKILEAVDPKHLFSVELVSRCAPELELPEDSVADCGIVLDKTNLSDFQLLQYRDGGVSLEQAFELIRTDEQARTFLGAMYRFLWGLYKMADEGVGHFDIKPDNITYDGSHLYLIDYGSVRTFNDVLNALDAVGDEATYQFRNHEVERRTGLDLYTPYETWPLEFPFMVFGPGDGDRHAGLTKEKKMKLLFPEGAASIQRDIYMNRVYDYTANKESMQTYILQKLMKLAETSTGDRDIRQKIFLTADTYAFGLVYAYLSHRPGVHPLLTQAFVGGLYQFVLPSAFDRYNAPNILDEYAKWAGSRGVELPDMEREMKAPAHIGAPTAPFLSRAHVRAVAAPPIIQTPSPI